MNAASGNSGGWRQWNVDLSAWAGQSVEVSIAYASDWSVQGVGAFVDDITYPDGATESFDSCLGGWSLAPAPPSSAANANTWTRTDASGFQVGNSITTPGPVRASAYRGGGRWFWLVGLGRLDEGPWAVQTPCVPRRPMRPHSMVRWLREVPRWFQTPQRAPCTRWGKTLSQLVTASRDADSNDVAAPGQDCSGPKSAVSL